MVQSGLPGLDVRNSPQRRVYGEFIARNPRYFARTGRRVVSYWSCYHRWRYRDFASHPGGVLLRSLRLAAADHR